MAYNDIEKMMKAQLAAGKEENKNDKPAPKKAAKTETKNDTQAGSVIVIPKNKADEKTKRYTFSMMPGTRKKLGKLAKHNGYRSDSQFFSELVDNMYKQQFKK